MGSRLDLLVEGCVVIGTKSVETFTSAHTGQILASLEATGNRLGFLSNVGEPHLRDGIKRVIL